MALLFSIAALVLAAGAIRFYNINHAEPYVYHPDEPVLAVHAMRMVARRDWNPHFYSWPSGMFYAEASAVAVVRKLTDAPLRVPVRRVFAGLPDRSRSEPLPSQFPYFVAGRAIVAFLGTLTVLGVWAATAAVKFNPAAPFISAAILAASALHVEHSHHLTTDVPAGCFVALSLFLSFRAIATADVRGLLLAAAAAGVAASIKYNAGLILVAPALAYVLQATSPRELMRVLLTKTSIALALAFVLGFAVATPAAIFDPIAVVRGVQNVTRHYSTGHLGAEGTDNWAYYLRSLADEGLGPIVAVLFVIAVFYAFRRRTPADIILLAFTGLYSLALVAPVVRFERNLVPLLPVAAILSGRLIAEISTIMRRATTHFLRRAGAHASASAAPAVATAALVAIATAPSAALAVSGAARLGEQDTRTVALAWLKTNIPDRASVIREGYTPQLVAPYQVGRVSWLSGHDLDWYRRVGTDYLVASSYLYGRPTVGHSQYGFYERLLALPRVHTVEPRDGLNGPTIVIVRIPQSVSANTPTPRRRVV